MIFFTFGQVKDLFVGASVGKIIGLSLIGVVIAVLMFIIGNSIYYNDDEENFGTVKKAGFFAFLSFLPSFTDIIGVDITIHEGFTYSFYGGLVVILIMNIVRFGLLRAIPYTVFQCTVGTVVGALLGILTFKMIAAFGVVIVVIIVVKIAISGITGGGGETSSVSSPKVPEHFRNPATNIYYTIDTRPTAGNKKFFILNDDTHERVLIWESDTKGRYIDGKGNQYFDSTGG